MASAPRPRDEHAAGRIASSSAIGGFLAALALTALSGRLALNERAGGATVLGALGISVAILAPFVASLASFLTRGQELRRSVWLASGVLALCLGGITIFSGFGLVFGMVGVGLISAWWFTKSRAGLLGRARSIALTGWLLLWLGGALPVLWLRETPVCWNSTATGSGWETEASPPSSACMSDIVDNTEGPLALVCVVIGLAGMTLIVRGGGVDRDVALGPGDLC